MAIKQLKAWSGEFGIAYTVRNSQAVAELDTLFLDEYGISASSLLKAACSSLSVQSVLEVGCNIGNKLAILHNLGCTRLTGIDPQMYALRIGKLRYPFVNFLQGTVYNIPCKDHSFDMVLTSGVLIHIPPNDLSKALSEIVRVSKKYILGFEYFSERPMQVTYRGKQRLLWKQDFKQVYRTLFPEWSVRYQKKLSHKTQVGEKKYSELFVLSR